MPDNRVIGEITVSGVHRYQRKRWKPARIGPQLVEQTHLGGELRVSFRAGEGGRDNGPHCLDIARLLSSDQHTLSVAILYQFVHPDRAVPSPCD